MTCPICERGPDVKHGRMACHWRYATRLALQLNAPTAVVARDLTRMAHEDVPPEDDGQPSERLRLAWWVVRRACREWLWWPLHEHAVIAQRDAKMARKPLSWQDESDPVGARARRDVARIAADRWALAALEEFATPPEPSP